MSENDSGETPPAQIISAQIIGQATAVLAVAAAVVYAAGGLSLGLKLWYDQFPWELVLGQLPKDFLLVDAIIVVAFAIVICIAFYLLPKINVKGLQEILGVAVLAFAFIPVVASVNATTRFPIVKLCGPEFINQGTNSRYAIGNLIGTNGQWVYLSEAVTSSSSPDKFLGSYIAVIPLSAVQLESIGADASCGDLHAPATPAG